MIDDNEFGKKKKDMPADDEPWWNKVKVGGQGLPGIGNGQPQQRYQGQGPQYAGSPSPAAQNGAAVYDDSDVMSGKLKIIGIVVGVIAAIALLGGGAAYAIPNIMASQEQQQEDESPVEEAPQEPSDVYLTVYADGAGEGTSNTTVSVLKGEDGEDVALSSNAAVGQRVKIGLLEEGKYRLHVLTVPTNTDGSTYLAPLFDMSFEVTGDGQDIDLTLNLDPANSSNGESSEGTVANDDSQPVPVGATDTGLAADEVEPESTQSDDVAGGSSGSSQHTHSWVAQTTSRHHDAVYRTVNHAAVKERHCICSTCGADITGSYATHKSSTGHNDYRYETKTVKEAYTEKVLVSGAYDETVTTGYRCSSCGATKSK